MGIDAEETGKEKISLGQLVTLPSMELDQDIMSADYFIEHWKEVLPRYIGKGRPSADTMANYVSAVNQFIEWCLKRKRHPLSVSDYNMREYLEWLFFKGYKNDTVTIKFVALRKFFAVAQKLELIKRSPCVDVRTPGQTQEELIKFFTPDQIYEICQTYEAQEDSRFRAARNLAIIYLMCVEGLRTVEIYRMNREDIDWEVSAIHVRGKGRDRFVYPCEDTLHRILAYYELCPDGVKKDGPFTPVFLSDSNLNVNGRMSRNGIRFVIDRILEMNGFKKHGVSCHTFRHSAGTNLYAATKDLRLVQETLGHRDPKTTARYAHVQERMTRRATAAITPRPKEEEEKP